MPIPPEISDLITELGLPIGAVGLAAGLVRAAGALEKGANPGALKYVSEVLLSSDLATLGKAGITSVPIVFDGVFGKNPLSLKFIYRSIIVTTLFWIILSLPLHPTLRNFSDILSNAWEVVLTWYLIDWLSLLKARFLLKFLLRGDDTNFTKILLFFLLDVSLCFLLMTAYVVVFATSERIFLGHYHYVLFDEIIYDLKVLFDLEWAQQYLHSIQNKSEIIWSSIAIPSTLLTSTWTFLLLLSSIVVQLLAPIDKLRKFTIWWFKDVDRHPLTSIAKVAATFIILGAGIIKVARWV